MKEFWNLDPHQYLLQLSSLLLDISVLSKDFHQANVLKPKAQDVPLDSVVFRTELSLDMRLTDTLIPSLGVYRLRES